MTSKKEIINLIDSFFPCDLYNQNNLIGSFRMSGSSILIQPHSGTLPYFETSRLHDSGPFNLIG